MKKLIIFDLDGTLLDSLQDIADSVNHVLSQYGYATHPYESFSLFVGDGITTLAERVLPETHRHEKEIKEFLRSLRDEYGKRWHIKTRPYRGIPEVLAALKEGNVQCAVLSNKPHQMTVLMVEKLLSNMTFQYVLGEKDGNQKKPAPDGVYEILRALSVTADDCLYVGDTNTDMETARRAGIVSLGATWGFRTEEELRTSGATHIIHHPKEIMEYL